MFLRRVSLQLTKPLFRLFSQSKVPLPQNPTMAESFGTKFTKDELQIIMDPKGYLDADEKAEIKEESEVKSTVVPQPEAAKQTEQPEPAKQEESLGAQGLAYGKMEKQYGFKYNGPQPTRFGDWCLKGKCVDF